MLDLGYDYATCVRNSEKVSWKLDDVMPPGTSLDFSRPFLPSVFSGERQLAGLREPEKLKLNHISSNSYVNLFAFVEEYIIATAIDHARAEIASDPTTVRALLRFADEEVKHQMLFTRYCAAFAAGFGSECKVLGNAAEVARIILGHSPIAIMLMTLHLEIMTQAHYTESVRDNHVIDPLFASLLQYHWLEEAQHARIDALELDKLADRASREQIERGFDEYLGLCAAVDGLLESQCGMDLDSFERACSRRLSASERAELFAAQQAAYRHTFLVSGMTNKLFVDLVRRLSPSGAERLAETAASFA